MHNVLADSGRTIAVAASLRARGTTILGDHMHKGVRLLVAAMAIGGALTLGGCAVLQDFLGGSDPVRDEETGEVIESNDNADVFAIRVGDCLNTSELGEDISSVPVVPCGDPHEDEVFHSFDLVDGEFPGDDAINAQVEPICIAEFGDFIGLPYDESVLGLFPMYPTAESWATGDREVLCIAFDPDQLTTGTLEGSAR